MGERRTEFDGRVPAGVTLAEYCADALAVHVFRHQVALVVRAAGWPARARAIECCGEAGAQLRCKGCGGFHVVPFRCGARSCPTCARIGSAEMVSRVVKRLTVGMSRIDGWEGAGDEQPRAWFMFTGTQQTAGAYGARDRYDPKALRDGIMRVREGWGRFWRSLPWGAQVVKIRDRIDPDGVYLGRRRTKVMRRDTGFAMGLEVAPGGMVHVHAAIYGERLAFPDVWAAWRAAIRKDGFIKLKKLRDVSEDRIRASLREVLKYVTKGDRSPDRVVRAANVELALKGVRRVEIGGLLRIKGGLDLHPRDVIYAGAKNCDDCGVAGQWQWRQIRAPSYVATNGGFGSDHVERVSRRVKERKAYQPSLDDLRLVADLDASALPPGDDDAGSLSPFS